ncbi:MAG: hypothetical protein M5Z89_10150, partial [Olivibacter sp.]|nr:hypothetical protein [Olivibacter sp. UJ_SKK_5.1]
ATLSIVFFCVASLQMFDLDHSGFLHHRVVGVHLLRVVSFIIFEKYYLFRGMVSWKKRSYIETKKDLMVWVGLLFVE